MRNGTTQTNCEQRIHHLQILLVVQRPIIKPGHKASNNSSKKENKNHPSVFCFFTGSDGTLNPSLSFFADVAAPPPPPPI